MTLENMNKFARINNIEELILWVRQQFESTLDLMCNFQFPDGLYEYETQLGELGFSLFKFDESTALRTKRGTLYALDASYDYNAYNMYNWFSTSRPGYLCTQAYA